MSEDVASTIKRIFITMITTPKGNDYVRGIVKNPFEDQSTVNRPSLESLLYSFVSLIFTDFIVEICDAKKLKNLKKPRDTLRPTSK